jgi:acetyl-CoA acetyltransferase
MDNAVILSACRTPIGSFGGVSEDVDEPGPIPVEGRPLARILSYCRTGVDPMIIAMGPVEAMVIEAA